MIGVERWKTLQVNYDYTPEWGVVLLNSCHTPCALSIAHFMAEYDGLHTTLVSAFWLPKPMYSVSISNTDTGYALYCKTGLRPLKGLAV